jgi:hypothetical protein
LISLNKFSLIFLGLGLSTFLSANCFKEAMPTDEELLLTHRFDLCNIPELNKANERISKILDAKNEVISKGEAKIDNLYLTYKTSLSLVKHELDVKMRDVPKPDPEQFIDPSQRQKQIGIIKLY